MRRNYPRGAQRNPMEIYDVVHETIPNHQDIRRIIDHPRKLVTVNLCANPYTARDFPIFVEHTCYEDALKELDD